VKVSKGQMAEHRERIIVSASRGFRERGFGGVSVAELMKEAGLTHGGFYNHFDSKEDLMSLAVERAFDETAARWRGYIDRNPSRPVQAIVDGYLSGRHLEHPETGCIVAALGTETSRQNTSVRAMMSAGIERLLSILESKLPGRTAEQRRKRAVAIFSQMAGAMVLARSQSDASLAKEVLRNSSDSLAKTLSKNP
jgi:TetR/AcrR family transcriptional regulator, transcriptional repressor for nem operon